MLSDLAEIQTNQSFNACSHYLQVSKESDQKQPRKSGDIIFTIVSLWGYFLDFQGQITPKSVAQSGQN